VTDRHAAYIVTLDRDIRADDAEAILNALLMVKHVLSVKPVVASPEQHVAEPRANAAWMQRIIKMVDEAK
jgi:hypothetical protein